MASSTRDRVRINEGAREAKVSAILSLMPDNVLLCIFDFFVSRKTKEHDEASILACRRLNHRFQSLIRNVGLWHGVPLILSTGELNLGAFGVVCQRCKGTEGTLFHAIYRPLQQNFAVRRSKAFNSEEGVPYYLLRELAALKQLNHPNICCSYKINLHAGTLHFLFPYVETDMQSIIGSLRQNELIPKNVILHLLYQLLDALAYCHRRSIVHRNLKPKHLLIRYGPDASNPLHGASLQIADFALSRIILQSQKNLTLEVVTLWYRPPELLFGKRNYTSAVDMWSVGCVFAELLQGRPLFNGYTQIDQLFQIFHKLGTPSEESWCGLNDLPFYSAGLFPDWGPVQRINSLPDTSDEEMDLLLGMLAYDPMRRLSAEDALSHRIFDSNRPEINSPVMFCDPLDQCRSLCQSQHIFAGMDAHFAALQQANFLRMLQVPGEDLSAKVAYMLPGHGLERHRLILGLLEVVESYREHVCARTVHFAIGLFDRLCLISLPSQSSVLSELMVSTCLFISSKCEDNSYISAADLARNSSEDATFSTQDVLNAEEYILSKLSYDPFIPTAFDFACLYMDCMGEFKHVAVGELLTALARYLLEAALLSDKLLLFPPSKVAASILSYALACNGFTDTYPPVLAALSSHSKEEVNACFREVQNLHLHVHETIKHRYGTAEFMHVSEVLRPLDAALHMQS